VVGAEDGALVRVVVGAQRGRAETKVLVWVLVGVEARAIVRVVVGAQ
jgi:hypothetical protein